MPVRTRYPTPGVDHVARLADLLTGLTPEQLDRLRPTIVERFNRHTLALVERVLAERIAIGWRADPWSMANHLDKGIEDWPYSRLLAQRFRQAVVGEQRFQRWNQPAQTGKTTWLWRGIAWALDTYPHRRFIYMSWSKAISNEVSDHILSFSRDHASDLRYTLRQDREARGRWLTEQGGGFLAASLGSSAAGFGGSVIADDLLANWQQAHSPAARERAWSELVAVGALRLSMDDCLIVAHTRWHLDDPSGRIEKLMEENPAAPRFLATVLPMRARDNDPLGRAPGELLEPRRYDEAAVAQRRALLTSYLAAALEDQDPQPEQGGEIKREWWQWVDDLPGTFTSVVTSWDMKLKDKAGGDYVVGLAVGRVGAAYYVLGMLRGQYTMLRTKLAIALLSVRHPAATAHYIENTGNGPEVMAELRSGEDGFELTDELRGEFAMTDLEAEQVTAIMRNGLDHLQGVTPQGDKLTRARTHSIPKIESGNVYLPLGPHWPALIVDEHAAFPPKSGGHDDIVDALSQALAKISASSAVVAQTTGRSVGQTPRARASRTIRS